MPEQTPPTPPTPPAVPPPEGPKDERKLGELVFDVTEGVSSLVREEIQLAKKRLQKRRFPRANFPAHQSQARPHCQGNFPQDRFCGSRPGKAAIIKLQNRWHLGLASARRG